MSVSVQVLIKSLQDCMASIEDDYSSRWGRREEGEEEGKGRRRGGGGGGEGEEEGRGRRRGWEGDCGGTCAQTLMCMFVTIFLVTVLEVVMTTVTVREPVAIETVAGRGMAIAALLPARVTGSAIGAGSAGGSSRANLAVDSVTVLCHNTTPHTVHRRHSSYMSQTEKTKCPSQSLKSARVTDTRDNSQFHICIELLILYIDTEPLCTHMASLYYSLTVGGDAIFYRGRGRSDVWKHGVQRRAEHRGALPLLRGPGKSEGGRSQRGRRGM